MFEKIWKKLANIFKIRRFDLTFVCQRGRDYFAYPILAELEKQYKIHYVIIRHSREYLYKRLKGRVVWIEWALKPASVFSNRKLRGKKLFVRVLGSEVYTDWMEKINWSEIHRLIFVNRKREKEFKGSITNEVNTITIHNAIQIDHYAAKAVKASAKKLCCFSIAFLPWKGYKELLIFFAKLLERKDCFRLNLMAREAKKELEKKYFAELRKTIKMLDIEKKVTIKLRKNQIYIKDDHLNVTKFLHGNDIFLSFSKRESFHYAFAEALLCGLQGFYNSWYDNSAQYFWENWCYSSEDKMLSGILKWDELPISQKEKAIQQNRKYVVNHFNSSIVSQRFGRLLFKDE
ncbi:MAG: hypothetical protein GF353_00770 [Candidatus Lokiarchaeota archaeon]|nr:hypothetical protein [Candidatus Lokiarchaeota archaeon]